MRTTQNRAMARRVGVGLALVACLGVGSLADAQAGEQVAPPPVPSQHELAAVAAQVAQPTGTFAASAARALASPQDLVASGMSVPGVSAKADNAASGPVAPPPRPRLSGQAEATIASGSPSGVIESGSLAKITTGNLAAAGVTAE